MGTPEWFRYTSKKCQAQSSCRIQERKARIACGQDGIEKDFAQRNAGIISQADFSRNQEIAGKTFRIRNGSIGTEAESRKNVQGQEVCQK